MMRETKYRAWDNKTNSYVTAGFDVRVDGDGYIYRRVWGESGWERTSDLSLEFFTGRKDKNGKEIYAADTIKAIDPIALERGEESEYFGVVVWSNRSLAWSLEDKDGKFIELLCRAEQPKVIGNVHEKLLEEQKNGKDRN